MWMGGLMRLVHHCFKRMRLAELQPQDMQILLRTLPWDRRSPLGGAADGHLRLCYFACTKVVLPDTPR